MHKRRLILVSFLFSISILNINSVVAREDFSESPFTPRAYLLKYWNKEILSDLPKSLFLIEKASPLTAAESSKFSKLALDQISLSRNLHSFCKAAKLFCFPALSSNVGDKVAGNKNYGSGNQNYGAPASFSDQSNVGDNAAGNKNYGTNNKDYGGPASFGVQSDVGDRVAGNKNYGTNNKDYGARASVNEGYEGTGYEKEGRFFRESMLKKNNVMPMPDIRDKKPKRSFLPRSIVSKLPFSSSKIDELKLIFHADANSSMESILSNAISECERPPNSGETKRCVGSIEDMIDFATLVLGRSILVRNTENAAGSKKDIMIGSVKGINGGKVTESVSCHQSLYPYLLYYCHSVPKVHVYVAEIMNPKTKTKINNAIAICHVDTSTWSPTHEAFLSLRSSPGKIEVCHWMYENGMTWTIADSD